MAVRAGLLPGEALRLVRIRGTAPGLETRDRAGEASVNKTYIDAGVKPVALVQQELGYDPDALAELAKKYPAEPPEQDGGEPEPPPDGGPGAGADDPTDALAGGMSPESRRTLADVAGWLSECRRAGWLSEGIDLPNGEELVTADDLAEWLAEARDVSKLTKKVITDKRGHKRTVYVRSGEPAAKPKSAGRPTPGEREAAATAARSIAAAGPDATPADVGRMASSLSRMTKPQLKEMARELELKVGGRKAEIAGRLIDHVRANADRGERERSAEDFAAAVEGLKAQAEAERAAQAGLGGAARTVGKAARSAGKSILAWMERNENHWMLRAINTLPSTPDPFASESAAEPANPDAERDAIEVWKLAMLTALADEDYTAAMSLLEALGGPGDGATAAESAPRSGPPGPPPREGLTWNDDTKRWVRKDDGGGSGGEKSGSPSQNTGATLPTAKAVEAAPKTAVKPGFVDRVEVDGKSFAVKYSNQGNQSADKEVAVAELAAIAGVRVPAVQKTTVGGREALVMEWMSGGSLDQIPEAERQERMKQVPKADIDRVALFDYLIGSSDGHDGNYMLTDDNQLVVIDREYSLGHQVSQSQTYIAGAPLKYVAPDGYEPFHKFDKASLDEAAANGRKMAAHLESQGRPKEARGIMKRVAVIERLAQNPDKATSMQLGKEANVGARPPGESWLQSTLRDLMGR